MSHPPATPTPLIDNDRVRVTEWRFPPGTATGHHRHAYDYVVVPMSDGELTIRDVDGEHLARLVRGEPYYRGAGVEHDVINAGESEIVFVEIEVK